MSYSLKKNENDNLNNTSTKNEIQNLNFLQHRATGERVSIWVYFILSLSLSFVGMKHKK